MSGPRTINLVKIIILIVLGDVFSRAYVVLKSLEHDLEYKLLFFGLNYDPFYKL